MAALKQRLDELVETRNKDVAVLNDWVETWGEIPVLSERIGDVERLRVVTCGRTSMSNRQGLRIHH